MWQLRFMVMINQLGKFIPNFSWGHTAAKRALSKSSKWAWNNPQMKAFNKLKAELVKPMVLVPYNLETPTTVTANASSYGLGAAHCQKVDSVWKPVVFASRSLMETEWRYVEKEALGVTRACEKLSNYLRKEVQNWSRPVTSDNARWLKKKTGQLASLNSMISMEISQILLWGGTFPRKVAVHARCIVKSCLAIH